MKRLMLAAAVACSFLALAPVSRAELRKGDFVAVIGDSITEQKDYSVDIEAYLLMCKPAADLRVMQFGWGGDTSWGFHSRMDNDCLRFHPAVATTCFGMNDGAYSPMTPEKAKNYYEHQKGIVQAMKKAGVRCIVVGSPGAVDTWSFRRNTTLKDDQLSPEAEMYNKTLAAERDLAQRVAQEEGVAFANVFDPLMAAQAAAKQKYGVKYTVCGGDGVHPGHNGHLVMAYAMLKALGVDGNIGTITIDLASGKAEASEGHKILSAAAGSAEVESARYPYCFAGENLQDPSSTRGILPFVPFNQDLNRLTLVVKNAGTGKVKVTWGDKAKEFSAADVARGINLAAEFLDNPFSGPFANVIHPIFRQQNFETPMVKIWVNGLPRFKQELPEELDAYTRIIDAATKKDQGYQDAVIAAVKPVKHVIKVEVVK